MDQQKERITVRNFGPIQDVDIELGDLIVLIGAQASGKSLFLQMFKLLKDKSAIVTSLENYGFVVNNKLENLEVLDLRYQIVMGHI